MTGSRRQVTEEEARRGPGFGLPPPDTGSRALDLIANVLLVLIHAERRVDPFFRRPFDAVLRDRLSTLTTNLFNWKRRHERNDGLALAEERIQPGEEQHLQDIIDTFTAQIRGLWKPGYAERGGNTKTFGIVRAE